MAQIYYLKIYSYRGVKFSTPNTLFSHGDGNGVIGNKNYVRSQGTHGHLFLLLNVG